MHTWIQLERVNSILKCISADYKFYPIIGMFASQIVRKKMWQTDKLPDSLFEVDEEVTRNDVLGSA